MSFRVSILGLRVIGIGVIENYEYETKLAIQPCCLSVVCEPRAEISIRKMRFEYGWNSCTIGPCALHMEDKDAKQMYNM